MTRNHALSLVCSPLLAAALFASTASAQQGPPPGGPDQRGMQHDRREGGGPGEHGMGIVPPGTWWKNPEVVKALTLTPDQVKRLDDTLLSSRIQLIHMKASLEEEQIKLEPILSSNPPDQGRALAEISKIADLRADLEKANAKMLLGLRSVLTADQWTKLQAQHHNSGGRRGGGDGPDGQRGGRDGKGGQGGPGGRGGNLGNPPTPPMPPSED